MKSEWTIVCLGMLLSAVTAMATSMGLTAKGIPSISYTSLSTFVSNSWVTNIPIVGDIAKAISNVANVVAAPFIFIGNIVIFVANIANYSVSDIPTAITGFCMLGVGILVAIIVAKWVRGVGD